MPTGLKRTGRLGRPSGVTEWISPPLPVSTCFVTTGPSVQKGTALIWFVEKIAGGPG